MQLYETIHAMNIMTYVVRHQKHMDFSGIVSFVTANVSNADNITKAIDMFSGSSRG